MKVISNLNYRLSIYNKDSKSNIYKFITSLPIMLHNASETKWFLLDINNLNKALDFKNSEIKTQYVVFIAYLLVRGCLFQTII